MKSIFKFILVILISAASNQTFAFKSFYNLTVNFAGGFFNPDNQLTLGRICTGDTLQLSLRQKNGSSYSPSQASAINWIIDAYLPGDLVIYKSVTANGNTLVFDGGLRKDNGTFYIQLDSAGVSLTSGASLGGTFQVSPTFELGADLTSCVGFGSNLRNTLSTTGVAGVTYLWSNGATTPTLNTTTPGLYAVTVTNFIGTFTGSNIDRCLTVDKIQFSNYPRPVIDAGGTRYRCFNETLQLNAFFVTQSTPPNYTFVWQPTTNLSANNIQNPVLAKIASPNTYNVTVTDANFCRATSSVTVLNNPELKIKINQGDATLCKFVPLNLPTSILSAGTVNSISGYDYKWSPTVGLSSSTIAGPNVFAVSVAGINYVVTVSDLRLCTARDTVNIKATSLSLNFKNPIQDVVSICSGEIINNLATTRKGGVAPFVFNAWSPSSVLNKTNDTLYSTKALVENQKIIASISDGTGCTDRDSVIVILKPSPISTVGNLNQTLCIGNTKEIAAVADAQATDFNVLWSPNIRISNTASAKPIFTANDVVSEQTYFVSITSKANNCIALDTVNLATRNATPVEIQSPAEVVNGSSRVIINVENTFSAKQSDLSYLWEVKSIAGILDVTPATKTQKDLLVTFTDPGNYLINLFGTNSDGCVSNTSLDILAKSKIVKFFVPTVFSPSANDERNKTFRVFYSDTDIVQNSFKISVFNNVGQKVFESTDFDKMKNEGWSGDGVPVGVYTWVVQYQFDGGKTEKQTNTVTLIK